MIKATRTPRTAPLATTTLRVSSAAFASDVAAAPALVWGFALLVAVSRLLFRSQYLYHWDSVNFAYGLLHFDVRLGQPHAPGYVVYVALAWLVNALVGDANLSMQIISAVCSGLLAALLWRMAERFFPESPGAGPLAALLVGANPLLWFYGSVALPHVLDALITSAVAFLCWRLLRAPGESRLLLPSALLLGLAGGIRQQDLLFLLPLWLFSARRAGLRRIALALAGTALVCALWLWPLVTLSGGLRAYETTVTGYSHDFFQHTSVFQGAGLPGLLYNLDRLTRYTLYAAGFVLAGLLLSAGGWRGRIRERLGGERGWFLLLWGAPSLVFYTLIHMGQHGLIFTFLPPLLLAGAGLFAAAGRAGRAAGIAAAAACALLFVAAPEHLLPGGRVKVLNAATLRHLDGDFGRLFHTIRRRYPAGQTVIVAQNFRHVSYYLPEYPVATDFDRGETFMLWQGRRARRLSPFEFPATTRYLVILGPAPPPVRIAPGAASVAEAAGDLRVIRVPPAARVRWSRKAGGALTIASAAPRS